MRAADRGRGITEGGHPLSPMLMAGLKLHGPVLHSILRACFLEQGFLSQAAQRSAAGVNVCVQEPRQTSIVSGQVAALPL